MLAGEIDRTFATYLPCVLNHHGLVVITVWLNPHSSCLNPSSIPRSPRRNASNPSFCVNSMIFSSKKRRTYIMKHLKPPIFWLNNPWLSSPKNNPPFPPLERPPLSGATWQTAAVICLANERSCQFRSRPWAWPKATCNFMDNHHFSWVL